ncbi:MAG: CrcB family protein [Phycisphaerales bacterium]
MIDLLIVALGGAIGVMLRHGAITLARPAFPDYPAGTLIVNVLGCLVIGLLAGAWGSGPGGAPARLKLLVFTGVLGGFTTYSSFGLEFASMLREGRVGAALGHAALMNVLGLGAAVGGMTLTGRSGGAAG